jgi:hypothetical protein
VDDSERARPLSRQCRRLISLLRAARGTTSLLLRADEIIFARATVSVTERRSACGEALDSLKKRVVRCVYRHGSGHPSL